jgi:hypothetical protein
MLERIFGNGKSSAAGTVLAVFLGFVLFAPGYFPAVLQDAAKFVALGGAAAMGLWAADPGKKRG